MKIKARVITFQVDTRILSWGYLALYMDYYSRLWLGGVIAQGNRLSLDLVETLLAEVVPVSKKPKCW